MGSSSSTTYHEPAEIKNVHFESFEAGLPNLKDKTIAVTGCTSGTGLVAAKTCAKKGATVLMLNRPSERATTALKAVQELGKATHVDCDLMDFASVKAAAEQVTKLTKSLDVLCNNAGVMALTDSATNSAEIKITFRYSAT